MPDLIVLRLHPDKPAKGIDFMNYLQNLTITAFDRTVDTNLDHNGKGSQIGTASGLANSQAGLIIGPTNNFVDITTTSIMQHYIDIVVVNGPPIQVTLRILEAAATAVIVIPDAFIAAHHDYPSPDSLDIRMVLKQTVGGQSQDVVVSTTDYNVNVVSVPPNFNTLPPWNDQTYYFGSMPTVAPPIAAYISLVNPDPKLAYVELPSNGQPPNFEHLKDAIKVVLQNDLGDPAADLDHVSTLTAVQSRHIAAEIVWNRKAFPPPEPSHQPYWTTTAATPPPPPPTLGQMYTNPPADGASDQEMDQRESARKQFEGELSGYHATHDAEAERLAGFVFAASAAVKCEQLASIATSAGLSFPVITNTSPSTAIHEATVMLNHLPSDFTVSAAYFYALGARLPTQVTPDQRYNMALLESEDRLLSDFQTAIDADTISEPPGLTKEQAARRLHSLGLTSNSYPDVNVATSHLVRALLATWLAFTGTTQDIDNNFWKNQIVNGADNLKAAYLELILRVVTRNHESLIDAIKSTPFVDSAGVQFNVVTVAGLIKINKQQWRDFFLATFPPAQPPPGPRDPNNFNSPIPPPRIGLLPPFTMPGTPAERVEAFIRNLEKFFTVMPKLTVQKPSNASAVPAFDLSIGDVFNSFITTYNGRPGIAAFVFGTGWNTSAPQKAAVQLALATVFPGDSEAQAWLLQALGTIDSLFVVTSIGLPHLQFSLIEALFARGFTDSASIQALSQADFQEALTGTVAYPHAAAIYTKAGGTGVPPGPGKGQFKPINPDGLLTDCIPPIHLSPFGPVQYLHELLKVSQFSTCDDPMPEKDTNGNPVQDLQDLLSKRRSPLGDLHATQANLQTPLPLIDLVNESLEALAAAIATAGLPAATGGAVYDTASDEIAGHKLKTDCSHPITTSIGSNTSNNTSSTTITSSNDQASFLHDPATMFAALPQYSSPATPVAQPNAYVQLRTDFTSPLLPYSQPLDICRSYLCRLYTSRYDVMRRFRKDITEFVLDSASEPDAFQRHIWRYPVRIDIAREYLCISPEEYDLIFTHDIVTASNEGKQVLLWELYGFTADTVAGTPWTQIINKVSEFLKRTGLNYCEFIDLWHSGFVQFKRVGEELDFPDCEPCCLERLLIEFVEPSDPIEALKRLAIFIRLWRKMQLTHCCNYTFTQFQDICEVLQLFLADGSINPDFVRQLAAFQMLRDNWSLALTDRSDIQSGGTGADRTHLLALWVGSGARKWVWAVDHLLDQIEDYAERRHHCRRKSPEVVKLLAQNLDPLSRLAGFDPSITTDTWHTTPTHTLRFAEVLTKIYVSDFEIGEILFLFTANDHLGGNDPFPLPDENEAVDSPLHLPDDQEEHSLWALRRKLLNVRITEQEQASWSWTCIEACLRREFGYSSPFPSSSEGEPDALQSLGEHFFPCVLEICCCSKVDPKKRQYRTDLSDTSPLMWNTPPFEGPFRYDNATQELWTQLPLEDEEVNEKLSHIRQLKPAEQNAVRELYFMPRYDLAPFAFIFSNFTEAYEYLIQESDESKRWSFFQREFAQFYARCCIIAEHLASHVGAVTDQKIPEAVTLSWRLLRHLLADENMALTPWETDSGQVPDVTWGPQPNGGAFAALLGLIGTGLLGEFTPHGSGLLWREVRGPLSAFSHEKNKWNTPIPTVLPSMNLTLLPPDVERFAVLRNGFALNDANGAVLGGAQGFIVRWSGVLLVEKGGSYEFWAGDPTQDGTVPNFGSAENRHWRLTLKRGQQTWVLLNNRWGQGQEGEEAPPSHSPPITLRQGAYQLIVEFRQPQPSFVQRQEASHPQHTGFQIKYCGPDSENRIVAIPLEQLFRDVKEGTLSQHIELAGVAKHFLDSQYTSTLRDIRRTYQRAFKALLFSFRFCLSAKPIEGDFQSEIGYMLDHSDEFLGTSYYRVDASGGGSNDGNSSGSSSSSPGSSSSTGIFGVHNAYFNFNLLPLKDPYYSPSPSNDLRVQPTMKRQQALFDWWERVFDYVIMRMEAKSAREPPAWLLFYEAAQKQPDDPAQLLRHLGIDIRHAPLVLRYYPNYNITMPDLEDERWAVRAWHAEKWIRAMLRHFVPKTIGQARPDLWASDDPGLVEVAVGETQSGNQNLTKFFRDGCIENGEPRRYNEIKVLNDGLRQRARDALLAYLCGMNRVSLDPIRAGELAQEPNDLTDLLLQDVKVGICERVSRIEEAISCIQTFIQRCRLSGLEPSFTVSEALVHIWDRRFATFRVWEACKRREVYCENWIDWDELYKARKVDSFRFLESELRRSTLTVPVPGGLEWWPDQLPPAYPSLFTIQAREQAKMQLFKQDPVFEGLGLLGTPERDARPSWIAPIVYQPFGPPDTSRPIIDDNHNHDHSHNNKETSSTISKTHNSTSAMATTNNTQSPQIPLWIQAAIRLGTRFIRVAAAGIPPGSTAFIPRRPSQEKGCCADCGKVHPPLIDEYYFWLQDSRYFDEVGASYIDQAGKEHFNAVKQDANLGVESPNDPVNPTNDTDTSDWDRPDKLPSLLNWESWPMVHLYWCRFHNGEFKQPRRSDEGLRIKPDGNPELDFKGRTADSLLFEVSDVVVPEGYDTNPSAGFWPNAAGFRYDLDEDAAVALPLVNRLPLPDTTMFPPPLNAYPFFAYFAPGAHLEPPSLFSVAVTVAGTMRAHCRFEAALKWYELVFNPLQQDNSWAQCPISNNDNGQDNSRDISSKNNVVSVIPKSTSIVLGGTDDEPCCPTVLPSCCNNYNNSSNNNSNDMELAKYRSILLQYLETLLQWADALMCRNSPEAFQQATVILDTFKKIIGPRPVMVFTKDDSKNPMTVGDDPSKNPFVARPPPLNPRLMTLYERQEDRITLIHYCLNARRLRNGRPTIDMAYWGNTTLRDDWQTTAQACRDEDDWCMWCCSPYRFVFLVQKALDLASEVRALGAELLAAYEKGDADYLESLRATHERQLQELTLEVRQNQWREADWQLQALGKTREGAQTRRREFERLIIPPPLGLNAGETQYQTLTGTSMDSRSSGIISETTSQAMGLIPDIWIGVNGIFGTPLNYLDFPLGTKLAEVFATVARIMNGQADIASTNASLNLTQAGWVRREEEWRHQIEVIGIEIEQINRQILASERARDIALRELNNQQRQIEHSVEVQNFLRDKFTSHELYLFLQQETAALHYQAYQLALFTARQAERAFNYERGYTTRTFLPDYVWDNLHEGLMVGDRLQLALRQMEKAYLDANCREYELTKHISLRLNFPLDFLHLQVAGYCEIEIPEWLFDLDYPGQYMRRIKNVTLTIPCVVGPYTGVHCRLTLLSSTTRIDPRLRNPPAQCCSCCCGDTEPPPSPFCGSHSCCCIICKPKKAYNALPDDPRIVKQYSATEAIATSSGQNDSGMFELSFRDERYLPFEFAGAVSRWRIEIPQENNQFDLDTLSDVVLHLNYTSREGGEVLRKAANAVAQQYLPGSGLRFFDIRHEFPDAWQLFRRGTSGENKRSARELSLRLGRNMFPFLPCHEDLKITRLELFFEAAGAKPSAHKVVDFLIGHRIGHAKDDGERCECEVKYMTCIASSEWPCLYHGVLDVCLGPLDGSGYNDLGTFKFPDDIEDITRAFLVCGYTA